MGADGYAADPGEMVEAAKALRVGPVGSKLAAV